MFVTRKKYLEDMEQLRVGLEEHMNRRIDYLSRRVSCLEGVHSWAVRRNPSSTNQDDVYVKCQYCSKRQDGKVETATESVPPSSVYYNSAYPYPGYPFPPYYSYGVRY